MADDDAVFAAIARHRRGLADLVEPLDDVELDTPSLCQGWTVREVVAHVVTASRGNPLPFVVAAARSFGRPHAANRRVAVDAARRPFPDLVAALRRQAQSRFVPPLVGPRAPLADVIVHTADIARPLHRAQTVEPEALDLALAFVTGPRPIGFLPPGRLRGIALEATDLGRTYGAGAPLRGEGLDLLLAACGRRGAVDRLTGEGRTVLAARR